MLVALSDNIEGKFLSNLINLCYYITEYYEDEFISATGDSGLTFYDSMSTIEIASMMNDVGINILQLHFLLRILRHKISAKLFAPESKIIDLCGEMIVPQFGEYKYIHVVGSKPELILYWIRDFTAIFKKEVSLLVKSNLLKLDNISKIDVVIGGDRGQGTLRFPMKLLFVMKSSKNVERESSVAYILFKKDNGEILKNTIMNKLHDLFKLILK